MSVKLGCIQLGRFTALHAHGTDRHELGYHSRASVRPAVHAHGVRTLMTLWDVR